MPRELQDLLYQSVSSVNLLAVVVQARRALQELLNLSVLSVSSLVVVPVPRELQELLNH